MERPSPPPPEPSAGVDQDVDRPADPTTSQRSFSRGVGFVVQGLGATLFMLTTCLCCGLAFFEGDAMHRGFVDTPPGMTNIAPLLLFTNVLGSLALVAFGLGQQSDRGRIPAFGTAITSACMTVLYGLIVGMSVVSANVSSNWPAIAAGVLVVIFLITLLLTWTAAAQVWRHPPLSADAPTVPPDAFPDPLARPRQKHDSPAEGDIARQRQRLEDELHDLDDLERQVKRQNRTET